MDNIVSHVEQSILNANINKSKINLDILNIHGMSGEATRHFYNNLASLEDTRYLEIGTWKGSTICAAMCNNTGVFTCIDNWSEFGNFKLDFLQNFNKFKGENIATFIEDNCFNIDISKIGKFNIYMYDGNHDYESHYKALQYFYDCLDDTFIYIIDDWNGQHIRDGTNNAITDLNLNILYKNEIFTPFEHIGPLKYNGNCDSRPWASGCGIFVLKKNK
jgi:hypothetical protein